MEQTAESADDSRLKQHLIQARPELQSHLSAAQNLQRQLVASNSASGSETRRALRHRFPVAFTTATISRRCIQRQDESMMSSRRWRLASNPTRLDAVGRRHQDRRIARPPGRDLGGNHAAGDQLRGVDDLAYAVSGPAPSCRPDWGHPDCMASNASSEPPQGLRHGCNPGYRCRLWWDSHRRTSGASALAGCDL